MLDAVLLDALPQAARLKAMHPTNATEISFFMMMRSPFPNPKVSALPRPLCRATGHVRVRAILVQRTRIVYSITKFWAKSKALIRGCVAASKASDTCCFFSS